MQYSYRCTDNNLKMWGILRQVWYKPHSTAHGTFILHVRDQISRLRFNICNCETSRYFRRGTTVKSDEVGCRKRWRVGECFYDLSLAWLDRTAEQCQEMGWNSGGDDMQQKATPGWIWELSSLRRGHGLCMWGACSTSWATGAGHFYDI